jgi:hypothetical protein
MTPLPSQGLYDKVKATLYVVTGRR